MSDWSESKIFWHETARTAIFAILGALTAIMILKPFDQDLAYKAELDKTKLTLKTQVIDEYLSASYSYTAKALDAFKKKEESFGKGGDHNKEGQARIIKRYKNNALDPYKSATNRLNVYFGDDLKEALDKANTVSNTLWEYFNDLDKSHDWEAARVALIQANNDVARRALELAKLDETEI